MVSTGGRVKMPYAEKKKKEKTITAGFSRAQRERAKMVLPYLHPGDDPNGRPLRPVL